MTINKTSMAEQVISAREAMYEAQRHLTAVKRQAAREIAQEIIDTGKSMTRRDIAEMTGLTKFEVERHMGDYVYDPYLSGQGDNPLIMKKKKMMRTYVLLKEDGSIDMNTTAHIPFNGWVYSKR